MLVRMASSAAAAPSGGAQTFAALLAEFAAPEKKFPPARDLDGLAADVATLSYESALRAQARYRAFSGSLPAASPVGAEISSPAALPFEPDERARACSGNESFSTAPAPREKLRCASITVRLSPAENGLLRQRAAEAGLTVSAYLRSCTFEVESLRTQVKATLAQLRQSQAKAQAAEPRPARRIPRWLGWWPW